MGAVHGAVVNCVHSMERMTGGEVAGAAAAGKAIAKVGNALLGEDESEKKQLQRLAEGSPAMLLAADNRARRVAVKQAVMLQLFRPLAALVGVSKEYFDTDFPREMAEKVSDIPDEDLKSPSPSIAIPAMEGLRYSLNDDELKDMYLNLLTTASDSRRDSHAHPAFADIIKQLSPAEAGQLLEVLKADNLSIIRITMKAETGGSSVINNHVIDWMDPETSDRKSHEQAPLYIENWIRLGLILVDYARSYVAEGRYDFAELRPEFLQAEQSFQACSKGEDGVAESPIGFDKGMLIATSFGTEFLKSVTPRPALEGG